MEPDPHAFRRAIRTGDPFLARAAIEAGHVTRHDLSVRFERVLPGVFRIRGGQLTPSRRLRAVQLWAGDRAVTCGWSAALVHGERWFAARRPPEIAVPRRANMGPPPGVVVRYGEIPECDRRMVDGMAVTDPARTAIDVVRRVRGDVAVMAMDSVLAATGLGTTAVAFRLGECPRLHGRRRVADALALADPGAQSPPETRMRLLVHAAGHVGFETQVAVRDRDGARILTADLGDRRRRIALEYDGEHHLVREQRDWDSMVVLRAARAGWTVVRVTAGMLDSPGILLERLRELTARAG